MIDAHVHLWLKQAGKVNGLPVYDLGGGKSMFGDEVRQMLPPAMKQYIKNSMTGLKPILPRRNQTERQETG